MQGYGLGNTFRKFFRWITPLLAPVAARAATHVGTRALGAASGIMADVASGRPFKESAGDHINSTVANLKQDIERKLTGGGKRKRKQSKYKDIFSK